MQVAGKQREPEAKRVEEGSPRVEVGLELVEPGQFALARPVATAPMVPAAGKPARVAVVEAAPGLVAYREHQRLHLERQAAEKRRREELARRLERERRTTRFRWD